MCGQRWVLVLCQCWPQDNYCSGRGSSGEACFGGAFFHLLCVHLYFPPCFTHAGSPSFTPPPSRESTNVSCPSFVKMKAHLSSTLTNESNPVLPAISQAAKAWHCVAWESQITCVYAVSTGCDCQGEWRGENYCGRYETPLLDPETPQTLPWPWNICPPPPPPPKKAVKQFQTHQPCQSMLGVWTSASFFPFSGNRRGGPALFLPSYVCTNYIYVTLCSIGMGYLRFC